MINYITKDITTVEHGVIAHGVNCQGKMNAGVAKAIRAKWPNVYEIYRDMCTRYKPALLLGKCDFIIIVERPHVSYAKLFVANLFTQLTYGRKKMVYASVDAIDEAIGQCIIFCREMQLPLYMPRIGCGLGGLNWDTDVLPLVEKYAAFNGVPVFVCDL